MENNDLPAKKKIGIMGGTFNPIHYGHLIIAENARSQYALDKVLFVPTYHPPHKEFLGDDMFAHRLRMVGLAIKDNGYFALSDLESGSGGINYTYLSLESFGRMYPESQLFFIMGADSLFELESWVHPEKILKRAVILAAVRDCMDPDAVDSQISYLTGKFSGKIYRLDSPGFDVSSDLIRRRVRSKETIRYLTPPAVEEYIRENGLYI